MWKIFAHTNLAQGGSQGGCYLPQSRDSLLRLEHCRGPTVCESLHERLEADIKFTGWQLNPSRRCSHRPRRQAAADLAGKHKADGLGRKEQCLLRHARLGALLRLLGAPQKNLVQAGPGSTAQHRQEALGWEAGQQLGRVDPRVWPGTLNGAVERPQQHKNGPLVQGGPGPWLVSHWRRQIRADLL